MQSDGAGHGRVFHVLTESEPFSDHNGGAISRWVANVLRTDMAGIVLAPSADTSWAFPAGRLRCVPGLSRYARHSALAGRLMRWPMRCFLLRKALRPALDDLRPGDTVWIHNRPECAAALESLVHARGARIILHMHNSHLLHWPGHRVYAIGADAYVFVSRFLMQQAQERFPALGCCAVLHNGADRSIFYPRRDAGAPSCPPVVLFAGRLVPDKGVHVFVAAMRLVQGRGVALAGIVLGGAGFGASKPTKYVRELEQNAPGNVTFQPYCSGPSLGATFRAADMACVPSCWQDPMPLVVLEAMASGLPVVGSRSGGIPEMLAEGGGMLVDRGSAAQLADALEMLANNVGLRREMGQEAYSIFQTSFTWDVVRENYRRILDAVRDGNAVAIGVREAVTRPANVEVECTTFPRSA
jgi:spore coat protein SA